MEGNNTARARVRSLPARTRGFGWEGLLIYMKESSASLILSYKFVVK